MSNRISILVWHDTGEEEVPEDRRYLARFADGSILSFAPGTRSGYIIPLAWAELPAPSEATVDDLSIVMGGFLYASEASEKRRGMPAGALREPYDRLRALLPKEGTDS